MMQSRTTAKTVFINPNFKNTHINPNFLSKPSTTIHVNPAFLQKFDSLDNANNPMPRSQISVYHELTIPVSTVNQQSKLISKSRTKIIREPAQWKPTIGSNCINSVKTPLIKIGTKKLIRASSSTTTTISRSVEKNDFRKSNSSFSMDRKYKVDRRIRKVKLTNKTNISSRKQAFVTRYALSRTNFKENLSATRVLVTKRKLLRIGSSNQPSLKQKSSTGSVNKKLEMLNINGVLYKSTRNKLQKTDTNIKLNKKMEKSNAAGKRSIYIRGDQFVLDKSGYNLIRVTKQSEYHSKLKRIDIGGLTYVAKSQNLFVRTNTHKTRSHLSSARQKSINVLSKKLVKSNIPCLIFHKVGKCAAFERGRCPKVHSKMHVKICPKFLKGECNSEKCLLSHEITLSKMPTCKFFLQGCCVRDDCPYLHKKLNQKTEICSDFLKGFCHLAEKCNKRHEFVCQDYESTGKCEKPKCSYCRKKDKKIPAKQKSKQNQILASPRAEIIQVEDKQDKQDKRYFVGDSDVRENVSEKFLNKNQIFNDCADDNDDGDKVNTGSLLSGRPKLGDLPAFIPL